jgi:hypothetical protein
MLYYFVHLLRDDCSASFPRRRERAERVEGDVRVLAHKLALEAGLQLGLLLDLADSGGEDGGGLQGRAIAAYCGAKCYARGFT